MSKVKTQAPVSESEYEIRRPPIAEGCTLALALVIAAGILMASQTPRSQMLPLPELLGAASWLVLVGVIALLARISNFAWKVFKMVLAREALVYLVIAGMIEFVFVHDHTKGVYLVVLTALLVAFATSIALLMAFTVARYQPFDDHG